MPQHFVFLRIHDDRLGCAKKKIPVRLKKRGDTLENILFEFHGKINEYVAAEDDVLFAQMSKIFLQIQFLEPDHLFDFIIYGPDCIVLDEVPVPEFLG